MLGELPASTAQNISTSHNTRFEDGDTHKPLVLSDNLVRKLTSVYAAGPRNCFVRKERRSLVREGR